MLNDPKIEELRLKVVEEAEKSDSMYSELFTVSGMNVEIANKVARVLTDLTLLGRLFVQMGMSPAQIKTMISTELNNYVNSDEAVRNEMLRIFGEGADGSELFVRAAKLQNIRMLEAEIERIKEELKAPVLAPTPIARMVTQGENPTITLDPPVNKTLH
jgi:hypothetical protein